MTEARDWYESKRDGLGDEFLGLLGGTFDRIELNPFQYPIIHKTLRRALVDRFPYGVFYRIEESRIGVVAVLHTSRDPKLWKIRSREG
jgi:toxin ParE1/3/4